MVRIDENEMASVVCEAEGGCKEVNIAQVKDVMKAVLEYQADQFRKGNASGVVELIERHL